MTPAQFKEARQSLGLDQSEAAAVMGYGANTRISTIENSTTVPAQAAIIMGFLLITPRDKWPRI